MRQEEIHSTQLGSALFVTMWRTLRLDSTSACVERNAIHLTYRLYRSSLLMGISLTLILKPALTCFKHSKADPTILASLLDLICMLLKAMTFGEES